MRGHDPYDRTSLEVQILAYLKDRGHPVTMREVLEHISVDKQVVVCKLWDLKDEGLMTIREISDDQLVNITPQGIEIILGVYSGKGSCT